MNNSQTQMNSTDQKNKITRLPSDENTKSAPFTEEEMEKFQNHSEKGSFQRHSLTSGDHPYRKLSSRRFASPKVRKRASLASTFLSMQGHGENERVIITMSTPLWVADLVNRSGDKDGAVDRWRQRFVVESLKMISAGSPPSVANADDPDELRDWAEGSSERSKFIESAKEMIGVDADEENVTVLRMAQRLERFEVYFQVFEQLQEDAYDGAMYDATRVRRRKSAE